MEATGLAVLQYTKDEYLCESGNWTQHAEARNMNGQKVAATAGNACTWCLTGGLTAAAFDLELKHGWTGEERFNAWFDAMTTIKAVIPGIPDKNLAFGTVKMFLYNDRKETEFKDITELLDNGIDKIQEG